MYNDFWWCETEEESSSTRWVFRWERRCRCRGWKTRALVVTWSTRRQKDSASATRQHTESIAERLHEKAVFAVGFAIQNKSSGDTCTRTKKCREQQNSNPATSSGLIGRRDMYVYASNTILRCTASFRIQAPNNLRDCVFQTRVWRSKQDQSIPRAVVSKYFWDATPPSAVLSKKCQGRLWLYTLSKKVLVQLNCAENGAHHSRSGLPASWARPRAPPQNCWWLRGSKVLSSGRFAGCGT